MYEPAAFEVTPPIGQLMSHTFSTSPDLSNRENNPLFSKSLPCGGRERNLRNLDRSCRTKRTDMPWKLPNLRGAKQFTAWHHRVNKCRETRNMSKVPIMWLFSTVTLLNTVTSKGLWTATPHIRFTYRLFILLFQWEESFYNDRYHYHRCASCKTVSNLL